MFEPATWSVRQLVGQVNETLAGLFEGEVWVEGIISNLQRSNAGHVYFTLTEPEDERDPGDRRPPDTLAVTLFDWHRQNVNHHLRRSGGGVRMSDGVRVRIRGAVEIYGARSQLQLKMSGIDPVFTLGTLAAERARLLAELDADGLLHANRALPLPALPLRLALVTSIGSAAHADALDELSASGLAFDVVVVDARVQGADAVASITSALWTAASLDVALVALVRGGGARTDLAAFDHAAVARAVATSPIPVWTGLGHEIDRTVADEVAHRSWKTPTACAAAVVEQCRADVDRLDATWEAVLEATAVRMERAAVRLARVADRVARSARDDLDTAEARAVGSAHRARRLADAHLVRHHERLDAVRRTLVAAAPRRIGDEQRRVDAVAATVRAYDPAVTLARGWSVTRTADGQVARAADLTSGAALVTTLADGTVESTVTSATATSSTGTSSRGTSSPGAPAPPRAAPPPAPRR